MSIRVVLAEDNLLVRQGIRQLIEAVPDLELVAVCEGLDSLLAAVQATKPDVLLTDIRMPPTQTNEGIQVAARLRDLSPSTGVVVLSSYADADYAIALLEKGAAGRAYLLKERVSDPDQLLDAIREVARGGSVIDPKVVELLVAARTKERASPLAQLTPRERDVLNLVGEGRSNAAIAASLFLTEGAVEKHVNSIFSKLELGVERDVNRRVKATLLFLNER